MNKFTKKKLRYNGIASSFLVKIIEKSKLLKLEHLTLHATEFGMSVFKKFNFVKHIYPKLRLKL